MNIILDTDSYKFSHYRQNPEGTEFKSSYIEARGGAFGYTVFFGLQMLLHRWRESFPTMDDIRDAEDVVGAHIGPGVFDREGWEAIQRLGYLPLMIEAVPEGKCVPHGIPMVQVRNTDPRFPWLPAFVETALLRAVWYPSTVATLSREIKQIMRHHLELTCDTPDAVLPFMLHDFGSRGVSSAESAGIGGIAHLVNFKGTDTIEALMYARRFYGDKMAGFSIPAAEHSTITVTGRAGEADFVRRMLREFGGSGKILAVVGDSYDIFNFAENIIGEELREEIKANGCRLVLRPDSGDPVEVVSEVMRMCFLKHGGERNAKGYNVLPPYLRVIQGDGVDMQSIDSILTRMTDNKISSENICFGMGGALLQKVNRDTCRFAMKTSAACINGVWQDVRKEPVTDKGKVSKSGIFQVGRNDGRWWWLNREAGEDGGLLEPVFCDGKMQRYQVLESVRQNAE